MKLFEADQIREIDAYTIVNEPISSIDLMERAGLALYDFVKDNIDKDKKIAVVAGKGNNGGDALVLARMMHPRFKFVDVFLVDGKRSVDAHKNKLRLEEEAHINTLDLTPVTSLKSYDIIIEGIFGTGLNKALNPYYDDLIHKVNSSGAEIISIDIPSGMYASQGEPNINQIIVKANQTLTLQFPKKAFFYQEMAHFLGAIHVLDIGLNKHICETLKTTEFYLTKLSIASIVKHRLKFSHKGNYGHGLVVGGAMDKSGAGLLCSKAALKSGIGLLTARVPQNAMVSYQASMPEVMLSMDEDPIEVCELPDLNPYAGLAIGPGLGKSKQAEKVFLEVLESNCKAKILDADALNILSEHREWYRKLNSNCILTPHPKEFERLTRKVDTHFKRVQLQREFAQKHGCFVILKGANTTVASPDGNLFFNTTGNPGMATAGSGDTLTGILLGLACQSYTLNQTALLGVYIHGLAADLALNSESEESLVASDIIVHLGKAFKSIKQLKTKEAN